MLAVAYRLKEQELENIKLFQDVDLNGIRELIETCPVIDLASGETLIQAGDLNEHLYLILSGRLKVHLQNKDELPITLLEAGESVGEISVIDQQATSAFVTAEEESRLLQVDEETLWRIVGQSHAVANNLLQTLAYRLRFGNSVLHRIQTLLREYEYDATIDPLTGLYNRRWLDNMLVRLMQRCQSGEMPLSVVMMDLDFFKQFNDTYGHLAGDKALQGIAKSLSLHLRPEDTITRFGGEELLGVFPGSDLEGVRLVADRLREAVEKTALFSITGERVPSLTLSLGIAQMQPGNSQEQLLEAADKALYRAKNNGRNQVND